MTFIRCRTCGELYQTYEIEYEDKAGVSHYGQCNRCYGKPLVFDHLGKKIGVE